VFSPGSAEINVKRGGKLNSYLMASCAEKIRTKNYLNLLIGFQVTVENVGDVYKAYSEMYAVTYRRRRDKILCD